MDYDEIAALERAIKEKYGQVSVLNPKSSWTEEKEEQFKKIIEEMYAKFCPRNVEVKYINLICCDKCNKMSFNTFDDLYLTKYGMCHKCFVTTMEK